MPACPKNPAQRGLYQAKGGPARDAWFESDKDLDAISEIMTLERMRDTLEHADDIAEDDCAF